MSATIITKFCPQDLFRCFVRPIALSGREKGAAILQLITAEPAHIRQRVSPVAKQAVLINIAPIINSNNHFTVIPITILQDINDESSGLLRMNSAISHFFALYVFIRQKQPIGPVMSADRVLWIAKTITR